MLRLCNSLFSRHKSKFFIWPAITLAALVLSAASAWAEELYYDDGSREGNAGGGGGVTVAVRFTVTEPAAVTGVKFLGAGSFKIQILDQGKLQVFASNQYDFVEYGWHTTDLSMENIVVSGDFYVRLEYVGGAIIGEDSQDPDARSYLSDLSAPPQTAYDLMIRAFVEPANQAQEVGIDIKFCSDPNAFNCKKKGVLPVTVFGTDEFDVTDIDVSTLQLCTEDLSVCTGSPLDYSMADRGDPASDLGAAQCTLVQDPPESGIWVEQDYLTLDGFLDLDVAFDAGEVQDMLEAFCDGSKNTASETLVVIGSTIGGTPIYSVPEGGGNVGTDQLWKVNK